MQGATYNVFGWKTGDNINYFIPYGRQTFLMLNTIKFVIPSLLTPLLIRNDFPAH